MHNEQRSVKEVGTQYLIFALKDIIQYPLNSQEIKVPAAHFDGIAKMLKLLFNKEYSWEVSKQEFKMVYQIVSKDLDTNKTKVIYRTHTANPEVKEIDIDQQII